MANSPAVRLSWETGLIKTLKSKGLCSFIRISVDTETKKNLGEFKEVTDRIQEIQPDRKRINCIQQIKYHRSP